MDSPSAIDRPTVARMLDDFGDDGLDIFDQLVGIFLADTERLLTELKHAAAIRDFEDAARKAHRIKGGSGQIGALMLRAESEVAESCAQRQDPVSLQACVGRIERHWPQVVAELAAFNELLRTEGRLAAGGDIAPNVVV